MKVLFVANWKIKYCDKKDKNLQPSDYCSKDEKFWFFKYFKNCYVEVLDISASRLVMKLEKKLRFVFHNVFKLFKNRNKYDLIMFHGTNGAVLFLLLKRIFHFKSAPIVVVDISSFQQASTSGIAFKLCQFASKKIDLLFYHTSIQDKYFKKYFPWLEAIFVAVGVDADYWSRYSHTNYEDYCVCVGYRKRDWNTLINAYEISNIKEKLILIGNDEIKTKNKNIIVLPFIPLNMLMNYLENAKFSIIPLDNFNYSFGQLTILQQMAIGLPIIAADVPALRDYIKHSKGVLNYESYNVLDLKNKMIEMSNKSIKDLTLMGNLSKSAIKENLSEEKMAAAFEKEMLKLLERGKVNE